MSDLQELMQFQKLIGGAENKVIDLHDKIDRLNYEIKCLEEVKKDYESGLSAREYLITTLKEGHQELRSHIDETGKRVKESEITLNEMKRTNAMLDDTFDHVYIGEYRPLCFHCSQCGHQADKA